MKRTALLFFAMTLAQTASGQAAASCGIDLKPLIAVHASRNFQLRTLPGRLPPPPVDVTEELLVTNGGGAGAVRVTTTLCCDIPERRLFASGVAGRADHARLRDLLAEVRVGALEDCVFENDLTTPTGGRTRGSYEVTWYGRANRRNRFTVVFADAGTAALPLCTPEVRQLIGGLRTFADALAADPKHLVCSSP